MLTLQPLFRGHRTPSSLLATLPLLLTALLVTASASLQAQRTQVAARALTAAASSSLTDAGQLPTSQPMTVTVRVAPTPDRAAALDQLLTSQITKASASYHQWLTPQQFAASYGATDSQLATLTAWAQSQGLTVAAVSQGKTRLTLTGTADQVQHAFAVTVHRYLSAGSTYYAPTTAPTVPATVSPMVSGVSGLDDLTPVADTITTVATSGRALAVTAADADPLTALASAVDANTAPIITLRLSACTADLAQSDLAAYHALLRQAAAQGITVLASNTCTTSDLSSTTTGKPSLLLSVPELTALNTATTTPDSAIGLTEARPDWQVASGLPDDAMRHQPDLTTTSTADFTQTLTTLLRETGTRQGNINSILYSLATSPGLYTQPDSAAAGTWEPATGLGLIDLAVLAKVFPRATGALATTTSLTADNYAVTYGQVITLTSKVLAPVYGNASISGTVTFTSSTQGTLGSATVDNTGTATLKLSGALNVGTYNITATYSGDALYASSTNTTPVIITVSIANGTIAATVSPASSVPYGSTATVTATVTLPNSGAAPSGTVTAVVEGVNGSSNTAILTTNPGGNSGTANITFSVPPPGSYTIEVTCAGNTNFQCQSPKDISPFTTVKGNTLVNITVNPAAPQAGQPVTLTANISSAGNGQGPYNFTGTVTFYDNGKIIGNGAIPVATNQASTSATLSGNITHSIVASYNGDTNWNAATSSPAAVNPTLLPSTLTLTANATSALAGSNIILTATVYTTVSNTVGPTGTVAFYDTYNGSIVQLGGSSGAIALTPNGPNQSIAKFTTTGLQAGSHSIYAIYNGDANFSTATSSTLPLTMTDYTVIMVPQTLTLKAGQTGQVVMLLGLVGGFSGTVSFGCTPPGGAEATCGFNPVTLQGGGSTTMTVTTTAAHARPTQQARDTGAPWNRPGRWSLGGGSAFAVLLCFLLPRRSRTLPLLLTTLLAISLIPSLGCGLGGTAPTNGGGSTPSDPGTPLGTQTFTITTAGNDGVNTSRHTYYYQVTIQ